METWRLERDSTGPLDCGRRPIHGLWILFWKGVKLNLNARRNNGALKVFIKMACESLFRDS
jgi:hypothetical protein